MQVDQLVQHALALGERIQRNADPDDRAEGTPGRAAKAQVVEFLRHYAGPKSAFLTQAEALTGHSSFLVGTLTAILDSYVEYLRAGLATGLSPRDRHRSTWCPMFLVKHTFQRSPFGGRRLAACAHWLTAGDTSSRRFGTERSTLADSSDRSRT
jgi:hypothetical protein